MYYDIHCNIVDMANQYLFAYYGIAFELKVFVSLPIKIMKAIDFIINLKEKYKLWHNIITMPETSS